MEDGRLLEFEGALCILLFAVTPEQETPFYISIKPHKLICVCRSEVFHEVMFCFVFFSYGQCAWQNMFCFMSYRKQNAGREAPLCPQLVSGRRGPPPSSGHSVHSPSAPAHDLLHCATYCSLSHVCVLALLPTRELPDAEAARPLTRPLLPAPRSRRRHASAVTRPGMRPLLCPHTRPSGHCHAAAPPTTHAHPPVAGSDLLIHPPQPRVFFGGLSLSCPPGLPPARWRASVSPSVLR